jgi:hypothetical protein
MMCLVVAGLMTLVSPLQDGPAQDDTAKKLEELTKRVEALEKERKSLLEQVENLERFGKEAAETISRLKRMIQNGGARSSTPSEPAPANGDGKAPKSAPGPDAPVHGKVLLVQAEHRFLIIGLGEDDGVKEGWTFEVIRANRELDGNVKNELLGKAVFEKYVETAQGRQSKLKITEGDPEKMKYGDSVVANRKLEPLPAMGAKDGAAEKEGPAKNGQKRHRIFGITGDTYMVDAGADHGLKQSDKVFIYRDKRAIAQLRLDRVERDWAAGKIIDGTKSAEPAQDDDVQLKDLKTGIVGKVKRIETTGAATGAWIEVGAHQGVKAGMQFDVRRQGKSVGRIVVKTLSQWHSVCEAVAPMTLDDLRTDDFIESVE